MSGYHRISKLKSCLSSLKNLKSINKINDTLHKELDALCSKTKLIQDSTGNLEEIKELNQLLTKEFSKATTKIKTGSNIVLKLANENITNCKTKLDETCRPLCTLPDAFEEKKEQYKRKVGSLAYLKPKHIRKEAEKLCQHLLKRQVYSSTLAWSAAGLSLKEDKATTAVNSAGIDYDATLENVAPLGTKAAVFDTQDMMYTTTNADLTKSASVLDKEFPSHLIEPAKGVESTMSDNSSADTLLERSRVEATADAYVDNTSPENTSFDTLLKSSHEKDFLVDASEAILDPIPEPPPIPDLSTEALNQLNALGEPTFASIGLGGWTPVGIVQNCMEYLHVTLGIDWWIAIALGTIVIRICLFPLVVLAQRNGAKMNNYLPQMQMIQMKMTEARQTGDSLNAARYSQELMVFMKEKGLNPLKNMIVPLAQAPIFVSFFVGLRQMANVPVDSLRTGGTLWFTDLTLPDQYFLLPVVTSLSLWLTVEIGTDAAKLSSQNMVMMKYVLRALPVIILPFTVNFPGVILCYWVSSNFISLAQVAFLRVPAVRDYFKIERMVTFQPDQLPTKPKGFTEGIKDSWTNLKITRELDERRRLDEMQFRSAGKGPVLKTYKYDPTKQTAPGSQTPISAKKR